MVKNAKEIKELKNAKKKKQTETSPSENPSEDNEQKVPSTDLSKKKARNSPESSPLQTEGVDEESKYKEVGDLIKKTK